MLMFALQLYSQCDICVVFLKVPFIMGFAHPFIFDNVFLDVTNRCTPLLINSEFGYYRYLNLS